MVKFFQRIVLRLAMLRPMSWVMARLLHRLDPIVMRMSGERASLTSLLSGLPVVTLVTRGRKSGLERRTPLIPQMDGERLIFISSNFGQKHYPGWHHNLLADPHAEVILRGERRKYLARLATDDEREKYWQMAVRSYPGYAAYARRAKGRKIGVWVLEREG